MKNNETIFKFKKGTQTKLILEATKKARTQQNLSKILSIPSRTLKHYKAEDFIIPKDRLNRIISYLGKDIKDFEILIESQLQKNWGAIKAGRKSRRNLNKNSMEKYMKYVRSFKKKQAILDPPLNSVLFELYGIIMGDGCICKYIDWEGNKRIDIVITGDKRYEQDYYKYIQKIIKDNYGFYSYIYNYKYINSIRITIKCKFFSQFFIKLGFPCGKKEGSLKIPHKLLKKGWPYLKYLARGLFDTDGSIFANKIEEYKYPYISISSKSEVLKTQLCKILKEKDYPAYVNGQNVLFRGKSNVIKWMNDVGTSNPKHKFKYDYWLKNGELPARLLKKGW
jgi:hypothetical protein